MRIAISEILGKPVSCDGKLAQVAGMACLGIWWRVSNTVLMPFTLVDDGLPNAAAVVPGMTFIGVAGKPVSPGVTTGALLDTLPSLELFELTELELFEEDLEELIIELVLDDIELSERLEDVIERLEDVTVRLEDIWLETLLGAWLICDADPKLPAIPDELEFAGFTEPPPPQAVSIVRTRPKPTVTT